MPPTSLPEPAGLSAVLGALAAGSMFRDMSGLAGTQALGQAASSGTLDAATEAGRINSANYQAATTQATEMGKTAADMFKVLKTSGGGSGGSGGTGSGGGSGGSSSGGISADGARVNHARDLDERGVSGGTAGGMGLTAGGDGSTDVMGPAPDWVYSRERSVSDALAGYSPDAIRATRSAIDITPASLPGAIAQQALFGQLVQGGLQWLVEKALLADLEARAEEAGLSLSGIELIPMRKHDLSAALRIYAAWTNSSTRIYVNLEQLAKDYQGLLAQGVHEVAARYDTYGDAVCTLIHEVQHAKDFKDNQEKPPDDFAEMMSFEKKANDAFLAWVGKPANRKKLTDDLGVSEGVVAAHEMSSKARSKWYGDRLGLSPADARTAMQGDGSLPRLIGGRSDYEVNVLYVTREP
jgi:hypothetical protein